MTNELSVEKAIDVLYTIRAYYASLTAGYPKGKDCIGIGDVMCSEIANSCLMAIKVLEQQPCEDIISRTELLSRIDAERKHLLDIKMDGAEHVIVHHARRIIEDMPSVTPTLEQINCLTGRPCEVCEFHSDNGCSKWKCIFEEGTK